MTQDLYKIANQLRILSIEATTRAGSGHPTSCCSAAELVSALFFGHMRFDPGNPRNLANDRFILSKGHAAPLLYAAWAKTGHVKVEDILKLRKFDSKFEGHPTPRLDFVDVATGSLGQGLGAGLGMAIAAKMTGSNANIYVLMGDGEVAEGSVWEAASLAGVRRCNNLVAIIDVNRLGQSQPTAFQRNLEVYRSRFEAFGWRAISIDGHDIEAILKAYRLVGATGDQPLAIIAGTIKGKGIPDIEDKEGWHGKILPRDQADAAIEHLSKNAQTAIGQVAIPKPPALEKLQHPKDYEVVTPASLEYEKGKPVATRKAFGNALLRIGKNHPEIIAIDGDTENSTYSNEFGRAFPSRFIEGFIAEQNMISMALGFSAFKKIPVASTFGCFLTRAFDQIRMAAISRANLKIVGTHCGVSIGEDGPSQMGLEDLAMMRSIADSVVFSPSDAVSTERVLDLMVANHGIHYARVARPESPILYNNDNEAFKIGGANVLRESDRDELVIVATGITVSEALKAQKKLADHGIAAAVIDAYCVKPIARELIARSAEKSTRRIMTVEDHSIFGGLGDAVAGALGELEVRVKKLGINGVPHSGSKDELMAEYKIDASSIFEEAKKWIERESKEAKKISA